MVAGNRPVKLVAALFAVVVLAFGCQIRDGGVPTEAGRELESADHDLKHDILALVEQISTPELGRSIKKSFESIERDLSKDKVEGAQAKALTLIDFIIHHYQNGDLIPQADLGTKVGTLNLKLMQFVGLLPAGDNVEGHACLPGDDSCEVFPADGVAEIPGSQIVEPFTLIAIEVDCSTLGEGINWVPPCYEVTTFPEQTFGTNGSTSLSLSQSHDTPVVGVCADIADGLTPGEDVFLWHDHDGTVEPTPFVPGLNACSETASAWADPLLARFQPVLEMLGPTPLYAAVGNFSINGSINNFSTLFACLPGCLVTTTTLEILDASGNPATEFDQGETIRFRAVVSPEPFNEQQSFPNLPGPIVAFYPSDPVQGPGAPLRTLVDGEHVLELACGSSRVPAGSHSAQVQFFGTNGHEGSVSEPVAYECLAGD